MLRCSDGDCDHNRILVALNVAMDNLHINAMPKESEQKRQMCLVALIDPFNS